MNSLFFCFSTDVDECELLSSVCGEAQCVNRDGTFQCECPSGQQYNVRVAKCEPAPTGDLTGGTLAEDLTGVLSCCEHAHRGCFPF